MEWLVTLYMDKIVVLSNPHAQGLGVPSKNENSKNDFFSWSKFCYCTKLKAKYVSLIKTMLSNEIKAFFVSLCFFALTFR